MSLIVLSQYRMKILCYFNNKINCQINVVIMAFVTSVSRLFDSKKDIVLNDDVFWLSSFEY